MTTKAAVTPQDAMANSATNENRELTAKELEAINGGWLTLYYFVTSGGTSTPTGSSGAGHPAGRRSWT
jgi:bacteriocin-like protein